MSETTETSLAVIVKESGLAPTKAQVLLDNFANYFEIAADWERKAQMLTITDASQVTEMKMAREGRLFLAKKRQAVENTRKELKAESLREGQTIDAIAKILKNLIEPIEEDLEKKEKFALLQEAARMEKLRAERTLDIQPFAEYAPTMDYGRLSEDEWAKLLNGAKLQYEAAVEAERKAEAERIAKEKAEAEERERIRKENERLKAEAEAREKEIEKQRKADAAERAKLQAEIQARDEAERKAKADAEKAKAEAEAKAKADAKKAAAAPDKAKLSALAREIKALPMPDVKSPEATETLASVRLLLDKAATYIDDKVKGM